MYAVNVQGRRQLPVYVGKVTMKNYAKIEVRVILHARQRSDETRRWMICYLILLTQVQAVWGNMVVSIVGLLPSI